MVDNQQSLAKYLARFKNLSVDHSKGSAPHKPVLLLSVLQAIAKGLIAKNIIYITPELVALFKTNWNLLVTTNHDCRFALPFYHLISDKFWKLIPNSGYENILSLKSAMRSFSNLNAAIAYAILDDELFLLMNDLETNQLFQQHILDEYFPNSKTNYHNPNDGHSKYFDELKANMLNQPAEIYRAETKRLLGLKNEEEVFIRGSIFKREVPKIYNNTCCISGMRIDSTLPVTMVDACHIVPFSVSYDDTVTNGIALCPNLHRAFDRGLIAIGDNYKVVVSNTFMEEKTSYSIRAFENKEIQLPNERKYWPVQENFGWHRNNVYKA
ncbi:MAG: HNH endonuclease [Bacteroidetes bacterium]|jgi:putative restriction endonuclease|nr:HNH endonuclease [Bacteroidota bacterium]